MRFAKFYYFYKRFFLSFYHIIPFYFVRVYIVSYFEIASCFYDGCLFFVIRCRNMIFFLSNFISIATLLFCDFIFLGKDRHFLANNLFMLCKFTMDAIQLIFFLFLSMIYKKNWVLVCYFG